MNRHERDPRMHLAGLVALGLLLALPAASGLDFVDTAEEAAVDWIHASTLGEQNFPETNGSGTCWGDVDGDGVEDLLLVNGLYHSEAVTAELDPRSALYITHGDGNFSDLSSAWGADVSGWGQGCSFADHDGDGDLDLIVVGYDMLVMLRNDGDRFTDITAASGVKLEGNCDGNPHCFGETASWADYDGDGDLDVYITQYGDYDIDEGGPVGPGALNGMSNILFRNDGDGTFTDVTDIAGVRDDPGPQRSKSFQSSWADYDRDGDPDLYIASDTTPNTLYRNNGDGTFTDVSIAAGVDDWGASMGLIFQDLNHDGLPDLYFTHYQNEHNGYYLNDGDGTFTAHSGEGDLSGDYEFVGWGASASDFDNDGLVDMLVVNGHTTHMLDHEQEPLLYRGHGDGTFTDIGASAGAAFQRESVARGLAVADVDLDGDLDFAIVDQYNNTARVVANTDDEARFLQLELREPTGMNRFAVGAEVTVTPVGGVPYTRIIQAGSSFLGQDSQTVHAGLGDAAAAAVTVRWPDGTVQAFAAIDADQRVRITKGLDTLVTDMITPFTDIMVEAGPTVAGWFNHTVGIDLRARDRGPGASGVTGTEIDDGTGWRPYDGPFQISADGTHVVHARSIDAAGNQEPVRSATIGIDRTAPTTTVRLEGTPGSDGWWHDRVTLRFEANDNLAGVAETRYRVNDRDWTTGTSVTLDRSGVHTVAYQSSDRAKNDEPVQTVEVKVDRDAPRAAFLDTPFAAGSGTVTLRVHAHDDTSGVRSVAFHMADEATPRHVDTVGGDGWSWTLSGPSGLHEVRAVATDAVGHSDEDTTRALLLPASPVLIGPAGLAPLVLVPLAGLVLTRRRSP